MSTSRPGDLPAAEAPLVSVVVVNHNRAEMLRECLRSLLDQTYPNLEIWVVDNGSRDESLKIVDCFDEPRLHLIALAENRGFAAANNLAFERAGGDFVALLNNDAVADPGWIAALMEAIQEAPSVGMCASKILFAGTRIIDKAGHLIYPDGQNRGRGTGEQDRGQFESLEEALFPDGCAALYRRRLLEEAAGFDSEFFAYADDADLGLRARWMGWGCLYVPAALVHHRHSSTSGRFSPQKIYWVERNRCWLAVKNLPLSWLMASPFLTAYRWALNLGAALRGRGAAGNFRRQASLGRLAITVLKALLDGLAGTPRMWRKRLRLRRSRRLSDRQFKKLLRRFKISARDLALRELE
ncbi:MAG: glycosyltransferase family 2 protein [Acidobacteriota bacterium]